MATLNEQLKGYWRLEDDLASGRFAQDTLNKTSLRLKRFGLVQLEQVAGSDRRLRNFPRRRGRRARGGIQFKVDRRGAEIQFRPAGLWGLIESSHPPTKPAIANTEAKIDPYWHQEADKQISRRLR